MPPGALCSVSWGALLLNSSFRGNNEENSKRFKEIVLEGFCKSSGVYSSASYLKYLFILSSKGNVTGTLPQIANPLIYFLNTTGLICIKAYRKRFLYLFSSHPLSIFLAP